ncbi:MAG: phage holin family protein [Acidobacteriota bacterium]
MPRNDERSVSDVLQDIFGNVQDIVRSEVRLAQAEIKTEAGKTARAAKSLIAGAVLGLYAGGLLLLAAVYGLSLFLQPWLSALAIGAFVSVIAAILITTGRERLSKVRKPEKTIRSVKEDVQWLKDQSR